MSERVRDENFVQRNYRRFAALTAASALMLGACGSSAKESSSTPTQDTTPGTEIEVDSGVTNYQITKIGESQAGNYTHLYTYQETYELDGTEWVCSVTVSELDGGVEAGGVAKSCK